MDHLGPDLGYFGPVWDYLGHDLSHVGRVLVHLLPVSGLSWLSWAPCFLLVHDLGYQEPVLGDLWPILNDLGLVMGLSWSILGLS